MLMMNSRAEGLQSTHQVVFVLVDLFIARFMESVFVKQQDKKYLVYRTLVYSLDRKTSGDNMVPFVM